MENEEIKVVEAEVGATDTPAQDPTPNAEIEALKSELESVKTQLAQAIKERDEVNENVLNSGIEPPKTKKRDLNAILEDIE